MNIQDQVSKILIVDDDEHFLKSMVRIFKEEPYKIFLANNAVAGLAQLKDQPMDLVVSDHMMPGMHGTKFLERVRKLYPETCRIMITGKAQYDDALRAVNEGEVYRIIAKPFDTDYLKSTIQMALDNKRVEEMLRKSEEKFRKLIENNNDAMVVVDSAGVVKYINNSVENLWRKKPNEIIGQEFGFVLTSGESTEIDIMRSKGEPGIGDMQVMEIEWENEPAFLVSVRDITDRKQMEEDLRQTVRELEKAKKKILEQQKAVIEEERLKVLLQMAGATAHELNQPLTVLLGNIQLMELKKENPEAVAEHIEKIDEAGNRIAEIVKKIQTIQHDEVKYYARDALIINLDQEIQILSIEDKDADFKVIEKIVNEISQVRLSRATSIAEALKEMDENSFDLIFTGHMLSDGDSMDFLKEIDWKGFEIPVVVITGKGNEQVATQALKAGAYDYLAKANVSNESISRVINNALEKFRLKKEVRKTMEIIAEMSTQDELTGLYNRRYFMEAFERELSSAQRYENELALCIIDLDHFKDINDTYGHQAGDVVLKEIALLMRDNLRGNDIPARYGGEEFAVILPNTDSENALMVCERFREMVAQHPFEYHSKKFNITTSIGITHYDRSVHNSTDKLIGLADLALYQAKKEGRNKVIIYGK